ncbi:hypothetical protein HMPREF3110_00350 [Staphylococcus sp. HMSC10C03]|uniref:hypothetical protein n=1 Tax=Staphylococcus sp. HMSC10C03 TaxID=1581078 RepID=UPI0008A5A475|nr:hypothetical protein [Staphylococcus sp. HMSC10C03]OFU81203.1 hypothetical protein HMPREF3110_00350 [Staphylococcus sp. HMSC10C03]
MTVDFYCILSIYSLHKEKEELKITKVYWDLGVEFLSQLFTGKLPTVFIILVVVSILLNFVIEYIYERFEKPEKNIVSSFLALLIEEVIGFIIFIFAFIAAIKFLDSVTLSNLTDTSAIALGEITLVSYVVFSVLSLPSLLLQFVKSNIGKLLNIVGQVIIGGLVYYVLFETLPMPITFDLLYTVVALFIVMILNIVLWSISINTLKDEKAAD